MVTLLGGGLHLVIKLQVPYFCAAYFSIRGTNHQRTYVCHPWGSNSSHSACKAKSVGMSYRKYYVIDYITYE